MSDPIQPPPPPHSPPPPPRSPFNAPQFDAVMPLNHEQVRDQLKIPAIIMMALAVLAFLMSFSGLFFDQSQMMEGYIDLLEPIMSESMEQSGQDWDTFKEQVLSNSQGSGIVGKIMTGLQLLMFLVIAFGAAAMLKAKNYVLCVLASVLSSIPCFGPCCCLGMIPGIWALVVLLKNDVRAAFV